MEEQILRKYYDPESAGSFGGVDRLKKANAKFSNKDILKALQTSATYTQHKRVRHKFRRRKVNVHTSNYLWQADLLCLSRLKHQNSHFQYILTTIDTFSKKAFAQPIKKKTGEDVANAFEQIITDATVAPKYLQVNNSWVHI